MRVNYTIATKWNQLSFWQLKMIGRILYANSEIEKKYFQHIIIIILAMKKPSFWNVLKTIFLFRQVPFSELKQYSNFILSEDDQLTKFPETIKVGSIFNKKILAGPGIRLSNISIQELSYADAFFYNWIKEPSTINLQRLVACLYRPIDKNAPLDDKREEFNKLLLPNNAVFTDKIPVHIQYIIALAYQGSRESIMNKFPYVFPKPKSEEEDTAPKKERKYQPFSKIINAMAMDDNKIFGTLNQTEKANAFQFLEIYNETIRQSINKK